MLFFKLNLGFCFHICIFFCPCASREASVSDNLGYHTVISTTRWKASDKTNGGLRLVVHIVFLACGQLQRQFSCRSWIEWQLRWWLTAVKQLLSVWGLRGSARCRERTIGTHQQLVLTANKHQVCVMFWSWSWWTFSCCLFIFFAFAARPSVLFRLIIFENVNG